MIDITLACEDVNSKLDEGHVGNTLLQIWKLRFGHKVEILKLMLKRDSEIVQEICSRFVNCELWSCDMNSTLGSVVPLAIF